MKKNFISRVINLSLILCTVIFSFLLISSSHREAPLIADDPLADNTDVYAFRSPERPNTITIIANYIPAQLPQGGPNYYHFGENIRYEVHIDNNIATAGDDVIYRFTFNRVNEDPTTFFNIRLGKQNLKTTYTLQRSINGGQSFQSVLTNGIVPPPNIGPRSITTNLGLQSPDYRTLMTGAFMKASTGERVFCGPADDPFFVDLGGIFDLGDAPRNNKTPGVDGLKCKNVSVIALQIDISTLQKDHKTVAQRQNILDPDYVIGVWASASRRKMRTLVTGQEMLMMDNDPNDNANNVKDAETGDWVQVSRLGMPLTNEVVIPIGYKDLWNRLTPYQDLATIGIFGKYFYRPELGLYMDDNFFGGAIQSFAPLRIQRNSLGAFGFGNNQNGLFPLKGTTAVAGTALDDAIAGNVLLPAPNSPRSVDLYPIFNTGVPNLRPYQLLTGKAMANPLAAGKPFIHNFLPNGGDMLRLNMAVDPTPRNHPLFSPLGLVQAAALGLTHPTYNANASLQSIPNMDGFPNGRRLEDDVTLIELQAVSGIVLAVLGLGYDDYTPGGSLLTPRFLSVYSYRTGVNKNDVSFTSGWPYVHQPFPGTDECDPGPEFDNPPFVENMNMKRNNSAVLNLASPEVFAASSPNPFKTNTTLRYSVQTPSQVSLVAYDAQGNMVKVLANKQHDAGMHSVDLNGASLSKGVYFIQVSKNGSVKQTVRVVKE